jgi:predicted RNA-binding Zn-ribbon protein involved in translation (DUF1610 family)
MGKVCIACGIAPIKPMKPAKDKENCPNCGGKETMRTVKASPRVKKAKRK